MERSINTRIRTFLPQVLPSLGHARGRRACWPPKCAFLILCPNQLTPTGCPLCTTRISSLGYKLWERRKASGRPLVFGGLLSKARDCFVGPKGKEVCPLGDCYASNASGHNERSTRQIGKVLPLQKPSQKVWDTPTHPFTTSAITILKHVCLLYSKSYMGLS